MRIGDAFPSILKRPRVFVKPDYPLLTVLYLLRMREIDAVPLTPDGEGRDLAIFGFTSLAKLLALGPVRFTNLLSRPCASVSEALPSLSVDDDLGTLLDSFAKRHLGVAMVHGKGAKEEKGALIGLMDILWLYKSGVISTDVRVRDVGSPLFSLPPGTSIRNALKAMFRHKCRRVFLRDERTYVSDRDIMDALFNPVAIDNISTGSKDPLAAAIGKLPRATPGRISRDETIFAATRKLDADHTSCLVTTNDRVVTPWDLVMKPWSSKRLTIAT